MSAKQDFKLVAQGPTRRIHPAHTSESVVTLFGNAVVQLPPCRPAAPGSGIRPAINSSVQESEPAKPVLESRVRVGISVA